MGVPVRDVPETVGTEVASAVPVRAPARQEVLRRVRAAVSVALCGFLVGGIAVGLLADGGIGGSSPGGGAVAVGVAVLGGVAALLAVHVVAGRTVDRVSSVFDQQTRILRAAAHELRSPVGWLQAVVEEGKSGSLGPAEALTEAEAAASEVNELIDDLAEAAEVISGAAPLAGDVVALDDVAAAVAERGSATAAKVLVDSLPVAATGSAALMRRAVSNLVRNAAAHGYGGGDGEIRIEVSDRGITVVDSGVGVDDARLRALRAQVPIGMQAGGNLGLGLALAGWVASVHGGRLDLQHNEPSGLRATIELPTRRAVQR